MATIKDIVDLAVQGGAFTGPKVTKMEPQVRTGIMFPLPDWLNSPEQDPLRAKPRQDGRMSHGRRSDDDH